MEMVEMNDVILDVLDPFDEVPDEPGVIGDAEIQGILYSSHGADGVYRRSNASYALGHQPGPPRIASFQNDLQPPEHGAGAPGVSHLPIVHLGLDSQVTFDTGNGIDCDFGGHLSSS
jgi:hypothetical protein